MQLNEFLKISSKNKDYRHILLNKEYLKNLSSKLDTDICWWDTPEGFNFWCHVCIRLKQLSELTKPKTGENSVISEDFYKYLQTLGYSKEYTKYSRWFDHPLGMNMTFHATKEGVDFWVYVCHRLNELGVH